MKIAIIEDEKYWQKEISGQIAAFYTSGSAEIICYDSGEEFLKKPLCFDVVFMDIELEGEDGFTVSRKYKKYYPESILVILTTHNEWCNKGYLVEAFRYLDKLHPDELQEALEGVSARLIRQQRMMFHVVSAGNINILCRNILYIETYERNLAVHTIQGIYECTGNISVLAEKMKSMGFYYIHRSYLVNIEEIISFSRKKVTLKNQEILDMSIYRYADFKEFYFSWKLEQCNG